MHKPKMKPGAMVLVGALIGLMAGLLGGCSDLGVKPWQRDLLARQDMQLISNPIQHAYDEHIYFSKEGTSGGQSFGGGGCGCN